MSPKVGFILFDQIEPRLRATMPYIRGVGSEDTEELLQDALAVAAKMLHDLEERGKEVTPGNIAYYTIIHMKSGRRSYSAGRTDVMNAGTQLDSLSLVHSLEDAYRGRQDGWAVRPLYGCGIPSKSRFGERKRHGATINPERNITMQTTEEKPINMIQYTAGSLLILGACTVVCSIAAVAKLVLRK